jgi:hypothetical protein
VSSIDNWRREARSDRPWQGIARAAAALRVVAPRLGLRHGEIAAHAIDPFLSEYRF